MPQSGINQGERGRPGEKIGTFIDNTNLSGNIQKYSTWDLWQTRLPIKILIILI